MFEDYNLLYGDTTPRFGVMSGSTHDVSGDPDFLDAANDDYHLDLTSAAIDVGTDVGVYTDIDGQTRPHDSGFDLGFDEMRIHLVYLPLILR